MLELFRYSTIAPVPAAREATEDFYFRGYLIRKSTSLIFNVHAVHYDERVWGDPLNFRPERFLTEDGTQINQKIADQLQVFGAGMWKHFMHRYYTLMLTRIIYFIWNIFASTNQ